MRVGEPKEIKDNEFRIGLKPAATLVPIADAILASAEELPTWLDQH
jgi:alanine dehydrogenase